MNGPKNKHRGKRPAPGGAAPAGRRSAPASSPPGSREATAPPSRGRRAEPGRRGEPAVRESPPQRGARPAARSGTAAPRDGEGARRAPDRGYRQGTGRTTSAATPGGRPARSGGPRSGPNAPALKPVPVVPVSRRAPSPRPAGAETTGASSGAPGAGGQSQKLQKVLAQAGLGSRREMEALIETGKVLVNGAPATLGMRVSPDDLVKVGRRQLRFKLSARLPRVIIYHKPEGEIVSREDPESRPSVFQHLPAIRSGKWLALGRLDFNTCGLLIFTTSGELANRMTHPRFEIEREYAVRIMGELTPEQKRALLQGVSLTDGPARLDVLEEQGGTGSNRWYRVIVREGRNRLVRRLFEHVGHTVSRLMRVRFGIINLPPHLKRGQHLELTEAQTRSVLEWLAGATGATTAPAPPESPPAPAPRRSAPRAPGRRGRTTR